MRRHIVRATLSMCCAVAMLLLVSVPSRAQGSWEAWAGVGAARQQGTAGRIRDGSAEFTAGAAILGKRISWGVEFGRVRFQGRQLVGTGGPATESTLTNNWASVMGILGGHRSVLTPTVGVGVGIAEVRDTADPMSVSVPTVLARVGLRASMRQLVAGVSLTQRYFVTGRGTGSDSERLRHYSLGLTIGVR